MRPSAKSLLTAIILPLMLVGILALLGCRSIATGVIKELYLNVGIEPSTLDPALTTDPSSQQVMRMLFASLVDIDPDTGAPQHSLATSWAVSADGLIWQFKLRSDLKWVRYIPSTDKVELNRSVTAEDVVYSVRRVFDPRTGSGFAQTFSSLIRGADQLRTADVKKINDASLQQLYANLGVQAIDDTTVQFILTRPASYFPSIVSTWLVRTQPREAIESGGSVWTEPGTIWTNGPYVLQTWWHGREIVLQKNPNWYDAGSVRIDRIHFYMYADPGVALDELRDGNLDSLDPYGGLSADDVDNIKDDPILGSQLQLIPTLCTHYYGFNTAKAPFNELLVRKAFAAAVDRETLVTSVVKLGEPASWFTHPGVFASFDISDTVGTPFNVNQARDYLRQAGYDKKKFGPITLGVNTNEDQERIAETVVQMWKNNLGVEVNTTTMDWKKYLQTLQASAPEMFRMGWCGYYPDAANFIESVFRSGSQDNFTRWSSGKLDQILTDAAMETDVAKRRALYRSAEKMLVEDGVAIIPLWWSARATLTRPNVQRTFAITDGYDRLETWSVQ